jgi:putative modified peptide
VADPKISKHHMLSLLDKLSSDDGFRSRFEQDPKSALSEAGIPAEHVATFPAEHVAPRVLPDKDFFVAERDRVENDIAAEYMCMIVPSSKLGRA